MKDLRIPGVLWVILIVVAVGLIHANAIWIEVNWHVEPWMIDMAITLLIGGLKTANVGTDQLDQALDVIDALLGRQTKTVASAQTRGLGDATVVPMVAVDDIPERPNTAMRWLLG